MTFHPTALCICANLWIFLISQFQTASLHNVGGISKKAVDRHIIHLEEVVVDIHNCDDVPAHQPHLPDYVINSQ